MQRTSAVHDDMTEAWTSARACIRRGDEYSNKRPVTALENLSAVRYACVDDAMSARCLCQLRRMGIATQPPDFERVVSTGLAR